MSRSTARANHRRGRFLLWGVPIWGALVASAWLTARRYQRWQVDGDSMRPTLLHGDFIMVDLQAYRRHLPRQSDVVLASDPRTDRPLLKRIASIDGDTATLLGDNPDDSTDSRHFGPVPLGSIRGRVTWRYWPNPLHGRIR